MKVKFNKDFLINELNLPEEALEDVIISNTRWSIIHEIIFEYEGKFYKTKYSIGATEMQYEKPWENANEVECVEVYKTQKLIESWEEKLIQVEIITISKKEYDELISRNEWLNCLEAAGVDNWEGYSYAHDLLNEGE